MGKKRKSTETLETHDSKVVDKSKDDKKKKKQAEDKATATEHTKPPSTSIEKDKSEIDDLFGKLKKKKDTNTNKEEGEPSKVQERPSKVIEGSKDDIFGHNNQSGRKRTQEGYRVFSEEELGMNSRGGGTALCPFDCDCCY